MLLILVFLASLLATYIIANLVSQAVRHHEAHRFFKKNAPSLPVLPGGSLLFGHMKQLVFHDKNHRLYIDLHNKFGPNFGFFCRDQPYIATKDLDLIKLIEIDQAQKHINRSVLGFPIDEIHYSIFQARDEDWRNSRKSIAPGLTNLKVRGDEVMVGVNMALKKLEISLLKKFDRVLATGQQSLIIDVKDSMERYTLAVIFYLMYKREDIDFEVDEDYWTHLMRSSARRMKHPVVIYGTGLPFLRSIARSLIGFVPVGKAFERLRDYVTSPMLANVEARKDPEKMKREGYRRTLIDYLIDSYLEKKIKNETFRATGTSLIMAGFNTTSTTLTVLIWHFARNPALQEKLRNIILTEGADCEYVTWTIYESIRWLPPTISGAGRVLGEDVTVNGTFLPRGAFVMPSTYAIHMDPKIWPEPEKFIPERFSDPNSRHPAAFLGFGLGIRDCVGSKLAIHEVRVMLEFLLTRYQIEACDETPKTLEFTSPACIIIDLKELIKVRLTKIPTAQGESSQLKQDDNQRCSVNIN